LEALADDQDAQKSEYSLTQHLANNLIDLYINLPSKNNYRRPATYTSKGYRTRRMAVDFAVPLITNVKIAKLLAEALIRKFPLDVSPIDFKTSHITFSFPGLVNIQAFVPGLTQKDSRDFEIVTEASVNAGFTTIQVIPFGVDGGIVSGTALDAAIVNVQGVAHCNYALSISASPNNADRLDEELQAVAKALFIPFNGVSDNINKVAAVAAHFASWPAEKPIVTDARSTDLATILLLASLHNRSVHVTDVGSKDDILLIALSKEKGLKVTCDVSVYSLFFSQEQYPASTHLPSLKDQQALWTNLAIVDVFAVGLAPYRLALDLGEDMSARSGIEETLPLLLTAVSQGRLTLDDIRERLHDNPIRIFELPELPHAQVEVEVDRRNVFTSYGGQWSPLEGQAVVGSVHRVVMHGKTVYLDGASFAGSLGRDVSSSQAVPSTRPSVRNGSFTATSRPTLEQHPPTSPTFAAANARSADMSLMALSASTVTREPSPSRLITLPPHPAFHRRHILSVKQFSHLDIHHLFDLAHEMRLQVERSGVIDILKGRVLCTVFYEPSTRTSSSFETAMKRLGGEVVSITPDKSSVMKGETLADTIRTLGCYGDAIVLRHPAVGSATTAAKFSPVPIINAGDGIGEHPTQV
jgi:carbamoyl-phosphate synthase / aspartate carbamoyltransferase